MKWKILILVVMVLVLSKGSFALTEITNCAGLESINGNLAEDYYLGNDIDCSGTANFSQIAKGTGTFIGSLDGRGYTISNVYSFQESDYGGFIRYATTAQIYNLTLNNCNFSGGAYSAILVGYANQATFLVRDVIINNSKINATGRNSGGVVGRFEIGTIKDVDVINSIVNVTSVNADYVGGITGGQYQATANAFYIYNSSFNGVVQGDGAVGGAIGYPYGDDNFNGIVTSGEVIGTSQVGGLVGSFQRGNIVNARSDMTVNCSGEYVGGLFGQISNNVGATEDFSNLYFNGTVDATGAGTYEGLYAGWVRSAVTNNSFVSGNIIGSSRAITYQCTSPCIIDNLHWNNRTGNPEAHSSGGTGVYEYNITDNNDAYFYDITNDPMAQWDFVTIWDDVLNTINYPVMIFEGITAEAPPSTEPQNTSLLAYNLNQSTTIVNSNLFENKYSFIFNTSETNSSHILMGSFNLLKTTGAGSSDVYINISLNGTQILTEKVRSVSRPPNDEGSTGHSPIAFSVPQGSHNITYSFRRTGAGDIEINDVDLNIGDFVTTQGNNVTGNLTPIDVSFNDTGFATAFTYNEYKALSSPSYHSATLFFETNASTTINCRLVGTDNSEYMIRTLSPGSTGSGIISYIETTNHTSESMSLVCQNSAEAEVNITGSIIYFSLTDNKNNTINHGYATNDLTSLASPRTLSAGTYNLANTSMVVRNGTGTFISATVSAYTTSGGQTPTFFINSSLDDSCYSKKERYFSTDNSRGVAYFYVSCFGTDSVGTNNSYGLWVTVPAGETLAIEDEAFAIFEVSPKDITNVNLAPTISITAPEADSSQTSNFYINWSVFDSSGDRYLVNITISNATNSYPILNNSFDTVSYFEFYPLELSMGTYNITAKVCENETTDLFCSNDSISISLVPETNPPNVTLHYPADTATVTTTTSIFNCSVVDDTSIANVSFYSNLNGTWEELSVNVSAVNDAVYRFNISMHYNDDYVWNCYACDALTGACGFASSNFTFTLSLPLFDFNVSDQGIEWLKLTWT